MVSKNDKIGGAAALAVGKGLYAVGFCELRPAHVRKRDMCFEAEHESVA